MNIYAGQKPQFKHDCDKCVFIGNDVALGNNGQHVPVDLYYCGNLDNLRDGFGTTFIMRYSDTPPDYNSMPIVALLESTSTNPLAEKARRLFKIRSVVLNTGI